MTIYSHLEPAYFGTIWTVRTIGRYEVEREIGRGAMGIVYRAKDPAIGRTVAIKTIRLSELAEEKELQQLRQRLMREAQSAGILSHPGIVTVYDVAEDESNAFIFMEFVEGETLEKLLLARQPPSREHLLRIFRQTAAALDFAHSKGIIHRDVKPANLMVTSGGDAKITDFGIAKIVSQQMTMTGMVLGTPYYMSPEQVQGHPVDGRSDQFSLAVIAYEILTGQRPYSADSLATLILKIVTETPPSPETLNPALDKSVSTVFSRVFAKDPRNRYPSCAEFVEDLARAVEASRNWQPSARAGNEDVGVAPPQGDAAPKDSHDVAAAATAVSGHNLPAPEAGVAPGGADQSAPATPAPTAIPSAPEVATADHKTSSSKRMTVVILAALAIAVGALATWTLIRGGGEIGEMQEQAATATAPVEPAELAAVPPLPDTGETGQPAAEPPVVEADQPPAEQAPPEPPRPAPTPSAPAAPSEYDVVFNTTPGGATVVVDKNPELTCTTPCTLTLEGGRHTIMINLAGYREVLKIFSAPEEQELNIGLEQMAGSLAIQTTPPGAAISIDGALRPEKTPALISLPARTYSVVLSLDGYSDYRDTIEIKDRVVANLDISWQ